MSEPPTLGPNEFTVLLRRPKTAPERRASKRHPCGPAVLALLHLDGRHATLEAAACDLSEGGIGLSLPYPLEVGAVVVLRLSGRDPANSTLMPARVAHVTEEPDGSWRVGCTFDRRLTAETLQSLLKG